MKVIIAANGPTLYSSVAKRFGHAPYYLLVDTATRQVEAIDNSGHDDETHAIIPQMIRQGVEVFIAGNLGPVAFKLVRSLNGQVALARQMLVGEALARLDKGELEILSAPALKRSVHDQSDIDIDHQ